MDCTVLRQLVSARCYCNEWDVDWRRRRDGASERVASEGKTEETRVGMGGAPAGQPRESRAGRAHRAGSSTSPTLRVHVNRLCALSSSCIFLVPTSVLEDPMHSRSHLPSTSTRTTASPVPLPPIRMHARGDSVSRFHIRPCLLITIAVSQISAPSLQPGVGSRSPQSCGVCRACKVCRAEMRRPRRAACGGVKESREQKKCGATMTDRHARLAQLH